MDDENSKDDPRNSMPGSRVGRFARLAGMTASVAAGYAGRRVKSIFQSSDAAQAAHEEGHRLSGERIARTLGELKGAAMKLGQMASIGSDLLPKELTESLAKLQREAPPVPFSVIEAQIISEFGEPPGRLFDYFDPEPFASASIGQVHRARTDDGREVIVKIQYPGVDSSVDSDLGHLKLALRAGGFLKGFSKAALDAVFQEVGERLHEELDYTNEAANVRRFRKHHAQHPFVVVPEVVGERSSQRILTLAWEPGDPMSELQNLGYTQEERNVLGENLFRVLVSQILDLNAVQADPNPANFAFRRDGTVVLYDFGCVKQLDEETMLPWRKLVRAALDDDYSEVAPQLKALGVQVEDAPQPPDSFYKAWRDFLLRPILIEEPYDFGASDVHREAFQLVKEHREWFSSFQPPSKLVFMNRAIIGTHGNLRTIGTIGNHRHVLDEALERAEARG